MLATFFISRHATNKKALNAFRFGSFTQKLKYINLKNIDNEISGSSETKVVIHTKAKEG